MNRPDRDQPLHSPMSRREFLRYAGLLSGGLLLSACGVAPAAVAPPTPTTPSLSPTRLPGDTNSAHLGKAIIAYAGGACEAPTFIAYEKGFFQAEGLEPELIALEANTLKEALAAGKIDGLQQTADSIKSIEQGLEIRITSGLHKGCIRLVAGADTGITKVADLKGKAVGVHVFGGLPQVLVQWALADAGLDPINDVTYKVFPPPQLEAAVEKGEIQAFVMYDPFPAIALNNKTVIQVFSTHDDQPYKDMFCCFIGVAKGVIDQQPEKAAAITQALQKAAYWVSQNQAEAARIVAAKKYVPASEELLASLLTLYDYVPNFGNAKAHFLRYAQVLKQVGVLEADTDPAALTDLAVLQVAPEFVPGSGHSHTPPSAQFPAHLIPELYAASPLVTCGPEHSHGHGQAQFYCKLNRA
ncbi:hypothetical protein OSCT_2153 [Oscillochloris trichoides DG-6]|uniref:ABC transporter substrate-binding protein n=1 Tax=Oscillochloris trichoides DG-6 TaxID=765420 RepID=E1IFQ2_9CHLR|nr:ABC transporter substrate-binding protein [Oscillochloris trichoides]EFO79943.1 hypothetical protein OSCT_2153 [Oscillochloris trichoides DG-6]